MASILQTVHTKLLKASPKIVLEKIVSLEMKELEEQLKEAKSEQASSNALVFSSFFFDRHRNFITLVFYVYISSSTFYYP